MQKFHPLMSELAVFPFFFFFFFHIIINWIFWFGLFGQINSYDKDDLSSIEMYFSSTFFKMMLYDMDQTINCRLLALLTLDFVVTTGNNTAP